MKKNILRVATFLMSLVILLSSSLSAFAGEPLYGVDISEHDAVVDFEELRDTGNSFVMIRLGWYNHLDKYFWQNVQKAHESGTEFGVYLYSYAYSTDEALIEANFVIDTLTQLCENTEYGEYFTLPVAYDMEDKLLLEHTNSSKTQLTKQLETFCTAIQNAGYTPMIYSNANWLTNYLDLDFIIEKEYKIWYASWYNKPNLSQNIKVCGRDIYPEMWQYHGGEGVGDFDRNIVFDIDALRAPICEHKFKRVIEKATPTKAGTSTPVCSKCGRRKTATVIPQITSITLETTSLTYNGKTRSPKVIVKNSKGKELVKNTDYTVTYPKDRKNVGKYGVKVTLIGDKYSGSKTVYFKINPKATSLVSLTPASKAFTVKWKKQATQTTGYQIQYSAYSNFKSPKTVTVASTKSVSKKITGVKGKKKYYVRIRTYKTISGKNYYSAWSKSKAVKTSGESSTTTQSRTVYITPTGKKYHYDNHCNGGTYKKSTLKEAKNKGLTPCKKCVS